MSKIVKVFQTVRNHWKKSIFFTGLTVWGAHYGHGKYLEFNLMKAYCQEALKYGEVRIGPMEKARHVTVLLNPVANKRKGKADYEKYCAPLFHLAGIKVSLVITEAEGQVKDLMEIMDNTDCVVVAGGDGTVHEAITGLLRRKDSSDALRRFPIGILPIGKNNSISYKLNSQIFDPKTDEKAKILAESSMAVIRQTLNNVDVMKIEGERGRPVYSIGFMNIGQLQDVFRKVDQYWYLGQRMKPYLALFFQSFKNLSAQWDESQEISIEYTKPCTGCSKCFQRYEMDSTEPSVESTLKTSNKRWWHSFMPLPKHTPPVIDPVAEAKKQLIETMKKTVNDDCDKWDTIKLGCKNILVQDTLNNSIELTIHPADMDRVSFIKDGARMFRKESPETGTVIQTKDCRIHTMFGDDVEKPVISHFNLVDQIEQNRPNAIKEIDESDNRDDGLDQTEQNIQKSDIKDDDNVDDNIGWISIDNECYEMPSKFEISLLPRRVLIYHHHQNC
ncbi:acylglycerol kinase-like protein Mulk [Dermatophagoides pteronyssinus]|uniref:acylglycerol kinase-like protein Mulk n=1 Tax=Dermatophagoides pteronyssinus TaxID=6956 RepID=UPI003F661865